MKEPRIFYLCPDNNKPVGGIKQIYRHVDILNKNGFCAFVLHNSLGFRCTWFENKTAIAYKKIFSTGIHIFLKKILFSRIFNPFYLFWCILNFLLHSGYRFEVLGVYKEYRGKIIRTKGENENIEFEKTDFLVIPEVYGPDIKDVAKGVKKVIFNQNAHYTFSRYSLKKNDLKTPYLSDDIVSTIVVSEHSSNYLKFAFPDINLVRIHCGIDGSVFKYSSQKKKQIAFMPRKLPEQLSQVINILKFRGVLNDFSLVAVDNKTEKEVAKILQESLIFLSFSTREGCPLPPLEAMACGCIVVGYHGGGGREYFNEEFSYPIEAENILVFAKTIEKVITEYTNDRSCLLNKGKQASEFINEKYSLEQEEQDVLNFWNAAIS